MKDIFLGKTAKMWLNEICLKQLANLHYKTKENLPKGTLPRFTCICTVKLSDKTMEVEAAGKSKQDAEQAAATEMLLRRMKITPAKLIAISDSSKKAGRMASGSGIVIKDDDDLDVSDTDDVELDSTENPVGKLVKICHMHDFGKQPVYTLVKWEGPPQKMVFTMRCSLKVESKGINVSFEGRRGKKQVAKNLAALRVLRELKKLGYDFNKRNPCSVFLTSSDSGDEEDEYFEAVEVQMQLTEEEKMQFRLELLKLTEDEGYKARLKAFQDAQEPRDNAANCCQAGTSMRQERYETLQYVIAQPNLMSTIQKFGGSVALLKKISEESQVSLRWESGTESGFRHKEFVVFVELVYPLNFKYHVPQTFSVHAGFGKTIISAREEAAREALKYLKTLISVSNKSQ